MRWLLVLVLVLACKDRTTTQAPKPSAAQGSAPRPSRAFDAEALAQHEVDGWTRDVRQADARGLDVRYRADSILVTVQIAPCFDCIPMELDRWRAKSDALRALIQPELRDHASTTWELGMLDQGGASVAWTFHAGEAGGMYGTAYTLYFNDGVNMIRVVAEDAGDGPRDVVSRSRLEDVARMFFVQLTQRWG